MKGSLDSERATKTILVTGASSGIGKAITETLSEAGCSVYATVRKKKDLEALGNLSNVRPIMMDVTKPAQVKRGFPRFVRPGRGSTGWSTTLRS
ncbi:MAG: SDR family NAD(P)-dependent oxidoreductase [Nitrososphaerota archaeon]|nr:SDR family NAD(P)-dependent oxidoreductase [Nitrososphaerota archaeon]